MNSGYESLLEKKNIYIHINIYIYLQYFYVIFFYPSLCYLFTFSIVTFDKRKFSILIANHKGNNLFNYKFGFIIYIIYKIYKSNLSNPLCSLRSLYLLQAIEDSPLNFPLKTLIYLHIMFNHSS